MINKITKDREGTHVVNVSILPTYVKIAFGETAIKLPLPHTSVRASTIAKPPNGWVTKASDGALPAHSCPCALMKRHIIPQESPLSAHIAQFTACGYRTAGASSGRALKPQQIADTPPHLVHGLVSTNTITDVAGAGAGAAAIAAIVAVVVLTNEKTRHVDDSNAEGTSTIRTFTPEDSAPSPRLCYTST